MAARHLFTTALFLFLPLAPAEGQGSPPTLGFAEETAVTWVMASAMITGVSSPLEPLSVEDFDLEVDGKKVKIESFHRGVETPLSLLFLQDLSGSMANGGKLDASYRALRCHLEEMHRDDSMVLATFAAGRVRVDLPRTSAVDRLAGSANSWQAYGTTALHDAIAWIPEVSHAPGAASAAILVTDGIDNASTLHAETARDLVRRAEIPVYVLALRGSQLATGRATITQDAPQTTGDAYGSRDFTPYAQVLRRLAESTGGRYFEIHRRATVEAACSVVLQELRSRYLLGFPLSNGGEEAYRGLRITIPGRNVHLRHRAGYLGPAPN